MAQESQWPDFIGMVVDMQAPVIHSWVYKRQTMDGG